MYFARILDSYDWGSTWNLALRSETFFRMIERVSGKFRNASPNSIFSTGDISTLGIWH